MTLFGTTQHGQDVQAITLSGHGLTVTLLTYGAILQDVRLDGLQHSLTCGSDHLSDYEGAMCYFGSVIAPVANRLKNARAEIAGTTHTFEPNLEGRHTLHSGKTAAQHFVWSIEDHGHDYAILSHFMPSSHGGFPGNRTVRAAFELLPQATLRLTLTTVTDAPSIANATNHSYWNLDGTGHLNGHDLRINADSYLPTDDLGLVTGEVRDVTSTPYDFRHGGTLSAGAPPLDHTFCVASDRGPLTDCAWITGATGVRMTVATTEPGVHIYDARDTGHKAIAVEAQGWPDAPNQPEFPSIIVTPQMPVQQVTQWRFERP